MAKVINERVTVEIDDDEVVVFLIGMRVNRWWKVWSWLPVALSMQRMLAELGAMPDSPLLAIRTGGPGVMVQYWRSFDDLVSYATDRTGQHYPAWAAFNRQLKDNGDVGIWHETFVVPRANIECVYNHMPPQGLAKVGSVVPAVGHKKSARQRLQRDNPPQDQPRRAA